MPTPMYFSVGMAIYVKSAAYARMRLRGSCAKDHTGRRVIHPFEL